MKTKNRTGGRMKFSGVLWSAFLSFLVVTGSACFLNREQEKEEKLKACLCSGVHSKQGKIPVEPVSGGVRTGEKYHRVRI